MPIVLRQRLHSKPDLLLQNRNAQPSEAVHKPYVQLVDRVLDDFHKEIFLQSDYRPRSCDPVGERLLVCESDAQILPRKRFCTSKAADRFEHSKLSQCN